jgi:sulfite exporter TauE/SafE
MARHAHWHGHAHDVSDASDVNDSGAHRHRHGALMVGMLHGTAGSAPLLALLPLSAQARPWFGVAYLLLFGFGVLLSMLLFGGALGALFRGLAQRSERLVRSLRMSVALGSIGFGGWLVHSAF